MYLFFLCNVNKFLSNIMCFDRPTSIIAFGGKSEELRLKFKEPPMLEYTFSKTAKDKLNALYLYENGQGHAPRSVISRELLESCRSI